MNNLQDIAGRIKNGQRVTDDERAYFITHDPFALFAFMIDNNPGPVNMTLRQMGYNHLGFAPDKKAIGAQVEILINRGEVEALSQITKNWILKPEGLTPSFINAFQSAINTVTV